MSQKQEPYRVECEDGERVVLVSYLPESGGVGWWNAAIEVNGRIENKLSQTGPRNAIARLAGHLAWPLVATMAPGEQSPTERAAKGLAQAERIEINRNMATKLARAEQAAARRGAEAMRLAAAGVCEATEEGRRTAESIRRLPLPGDRSRPAVTPPEDRLRRDPRGSRDTESERTGLRYDRTMKTNEMTHEGWKAVCEDGERSVLVSRSSDGWWNAATEVDGQVQRRISTKSARHAAVCLAEHLSWPLVSILAPGEQPPAERVRLLTEEINDAVSAIYRRAQSYSRLAAIGGTDTTSAEECRAACNAYEHAATIMRNELDEGVVREMSTASVGEASRIEFEHLQGLLDCARADVAKLTTERDAAQAAAESSMTLQHRMAEMIEEVERTAERRGAEAMCRAASGVCEAARLRHYETGRETGDATYWGNLANEHRRTAEAILELPLPGDVVTTRDASIAITEAPSFASALEAIRVGRMRCSECGDVREGCHAACVRCRACCTCGAHE